MTESSLQLLVIFYPPLNEILFMLARPLDSVSGTDFYLNRKSLRFIY